MITFRLAQHHIRPVQMVEVLINGRVSATITPGDTAEDELRVLTRHLKEMPLMHSDTELPEESTLHLIQIFLKRKD